MKNKQDQRLFLASLFIFLVALIGCSLQDQDESDKIVLDNPIIESIETISGVENLPTVMTSLQPTLTLMPTSTIAQVSRENQQFRNLCLATRIESDGQSNWPKQIVVPIGPYSGLDAVVEDENLSVNLLSVEKSKTQTLVYAAKELQLHLGLAGIDTPIIPLKSADLSVNSFFIAESESPISPEVLDNLPPIPEGGYAIQPIENNIFIVGESHESTLNGTYRLLDLLGFAWYDPFETAIPANLGKMQIEWENIVEGPKTKFRGFWMWREEEYLPDEFAIWMARNRLNIGGGFRPEVTQKLGIKQWAGGHHLLTETFNDEALFESHPEWYSTVNGRLRLANSSFNPSFANNEAADYFSDQLIERLQNGDLQNVDVVNVWPTDSRSELVWDQSDKANELGNKTDNLLYFYSIVANRLEGAYQTGALNRPVVLAGISYYLTWEAPTNSEIIESLADSPYIHIFYTNQRSWMHQIDDDLVTHQENERLVENLQKWSQGGPTLPSGVVEYHNYSIYSGIAIDDYEHIEQNYAYLTKNQNQLYAYMHPLFTNPGPRRLANFTFAQLGWENALCPDTSQQMNALRQRYFDNRFGEYADIWEDLYSKMSKSTQNAKEMFGENSLQWLVLKDIYWSQPTIQTSEVPEIAELFLEGGQNILIPPIETTHDGINISFLGLNDSRQIQQEASLVWRELIDNIEDPIIAARMKDDIVWFESTSDRYELLNLVVDYYNAEAQQREDKAQILIEIESTVNHLMKATTTNDTVTPFDQRGVLKSYMQFVELH